VARQCHRAAVRAMMPAVVRIAVDPVLLKR